MNPKELDKSWGGQYLYGFLTFFGRFIENVCGFGTDSIVAFGDDFADIGMLELCGTGVAMGNAIAEVKEKADIVIGTNDEEGIVDFLESEIAIKIEKNFSEKFYYKSLCNIISLV